MGYQLRRDLREALGPDITGLQRAVALEIADDANEDTRISWATLEELARWTGAKDSAVVRNALKRLAASGWEFRIPIGIAKKDGRVMYAKPGIRMTFRVPDFHTEAMAPPMERATAPPIGGAVATPQGVATAPSEGATATPETPQGGAPAHSEGAGAHSEGAGAPPYSSDPSSPHEEEASSVAPIDLKLFGEFWITYPKSRNKDATLEAWRTALAAGADPRKIITAAQAYAREKAGEDFRYVKYSVNWLRERRYEDTYAPEPNGRPHLRAVSGDWQPWQNPTDQSVYDEDLI
ncbi:hypothetical protein [Streptomyces murinus]|uniref:hypothetical protein n=1 Tax=Streptomyces murinus TaxID=33900 RepID=UPI00381A5D13